MIYFWFIFGAVVGSFLNVCIHRLPRGESIIFPPSHCVKCGTKLSPLDLIPILGYFLLKGKCRYCQASISFRYPLVEFLSATAFSLSWFYAREDILNFIFLTVFSLILLVIFFTDLEQQIIPDALSVLGIFSGLIYNYLHGMLHPWSSALSPFVSALFGMLLGYALLYVVGGVGRLWFKKEVMGEGDLYVAAFLGASLGWDGALLSIFLAYLLAAMVSLVLLLLGKVKFGQYIPFGPALVVGGVIALFYGAPIMHWYFSLFL